MDCIDTIDTRRTFKCVLLGQVNSGKTSIMMRYIKNNFCEHTDPTIGASFFSKKLQFYNDNIALDIWDTAGQERYESLMYMYYRNAKIVVIIYDITDRRSFEKAKYWVSMIKKQLDPEPIFILAGNKLDLEDKRQVLTEEGRKYSELEGLNFFETSAKKSYNINSMFTFAAKRANKKYSQVNILRRSDIVDISEYNAIGEDKKKIFSCCS